MKKNPTVLRHMIYIFYSIGKGVIVFKKKLYLLLNLEESPFGY